MMIALVHAHVRLFFVTTLTCPLRIYITVHQLRMCPRQHTSKKHNRNDYSCVSCPVSSKEYNQGLRILSTTIHYIFMNTQINYKKNTYCNIHTAQCLQFDLLFHCLLPIPARKVNCENLIQQ